MTRIRSIAAALTLLTVIGLSSESDAQCIPPRQGQRMVKQGEVSRFPDALRSAGFGADQLLGQPQLCRSGSIWVYRVTILRDGKKVGVDIPAGGRGY